MKNLITSLAYFLIVMSAFNFSNCKKKSVDSFCYTNRTTISNINAQKGMVIYYQKYDRYGVRFDTSLTGNIDSQVIGLSCDIPKELRSEGINIIVSGELKKFNDDENITPQMGGMNYII